MQCTPRDKQILETLACKVRYLSVELLAGSPWFRNCRSPAIHARRRLKALAEAGLVQRTGVLAQPMLALAVPVFCWRVGQNDPDCGAVAWQLQHRWSDAVGARRTTVYLATAMGNDLYGGPPRPKPIRRGHITHDLHLAAVFLHFLDARPEQAAAWIGEDLIPKAGFGFKDPDAFILGGDGEPTLVVEFGGRYDRQHIREFHEDCRSRERSYELW